MSAVSKQSVSPSWPAARVVAGAQLRTQQLEAEIRTLENRLQQQQAVQWVDEQLILWADRLRSTPGQSLAQWADARLAELTPAMDQSAGALYVLTQPDAEAEPFLTRVAGYALSGAESEHIQLGEGLVGQAARSRQPLYLHAPGAFSRRVRMGVSEAELHVLLLQPLVYNNRLEGVVELCGLREPSAEQRLLLERLRQPLAAALASVRNQSEIQHLYAQAQEQREELLAAEEEMRQNLEELQATQDQLREAQEALAQQMTAIHRSTGVMELGLDATVLSVNPLLAEILGYRPEQVVNQPHRMLLPEGGLVSEEAYAQLWERLRAGEFVSDTFPRRAADGTLRWLQGSYNPVLDRNGRPYRILKIVQDVTAARIAEAEAETSRAQLELTLQEAQFTMEELQQTEQRYRQQVAQLMARVDQLEAAPTT